MTDRLEEIRARWEKATPGPWVNLGGGVGTQRDDLVADFLDEDDAEAIAHAPEDIKRLLRIAEAAERVAEADSEEYRLALAMVVDAAPWDAEATARASETRSRAMDELRAALNPGEEK